jgi:ATP-dependent exoDNAse (exonuclease V) beta subunit
LKERKFLKFYSLKNFEAGEMIEIIDGNKKSPAIILKIEDAKDLKQEIRKGEIEMKKLKLSKTGDFANGKRIDKFEISEIKKFLKNPELAQKSENENLKKFFPKKRKKKERILAEPKSAPKGGAEISEILSFEKIVNRPKTYNSEMQELVDEIRNYFQEKAVSGTGSFSYYIGFFKRIPLRDVRQMFGEVKLARNKTTFEKKKLF